MKYYILDEVNSYKFTSRVHWHSMSLRKLLSLTISIKDVRPIRKNEHAIMEIYVICNSLLDATDAKQTETWLEH